MIKICQLLLWHLSISGIYQLLLIRFSPNFKSKINEPCLKEANCYGDICPGNICPGDICPNKQYLSCYWSDFDKTFCTHFFGDHDFCGPKCSWTKLLWTHLNTIFFSRPKILLGIQVFRPEILLNPKKIWTQIFFWPQIFSDLKFFRLG